MVFEFFKDQCRPACRKPPLAITPSFAAGQAEHPEAEYVF
jgi:hypothetical protein